MALLRPQPHVPSDRFTSTQGIWVAEESDLGRVPYGRVWDDACDVGFTVIGHGGDCVYAEEIGVRDAEGELMYTRFKPAKISDRSRWPDIHLFND